MVQTADILTWAIQAEDSPAHVARLIASALLAEGVVGKADDSFKVAQDTGSNMKIKVGSGTVGDLCAVAGDAAGQGVYVCEHQSGTVTLDVAAADADDGRIDLVVARVYDDEADSSGNSYADVEIVQGTPASSPTVPDTPDGAIALASIEVDASASSIADADITDLRVEAKVRIAAAETPIKRFERITSGQSISSGSETRVDFNSEVSSSPGSDDYFSESAGLVTCLKAGWIRVLAGIDWGTSTDGTRLVNIRQNSNRVASTRSTAASASTESTISTVVEVAANDTLDVSVVQDVGSSTTVDNSKTTFLVVEYIRASD